MTYVHTVNGCPHYIFHLRSSRPEPNSQTEDLALKVARLEMNLPSTKGQESARKKAIPTALPSKSKKIVVTQGQHTEDMPSREQRRPASHRGDMPRTATHTLLSIHILTLDASRRTHMPRRSMCAHAPTDTSTLRRRGGSSRNRLNYI